MSHLRHGPIGLREANTFVGIEHRHNKAVVGYKFALAAYMGAGKMVGVVIVGRTTAAALHVPLRAEITRLATDGTRNACSFLYRKATPRRSGDGLRLAQDVHAECEIEARSWARSNKKRVRVDQSEPAKRYRWELIGVVA